MVKYSQISSYFVCAPKIQISKESLESISNSIV